MERRQRQRRWCRGGEAQRESILCESRSARPPAAFSFFPALSASLLACPSPALFLSFSSLPRAILSSRICDHQHAKWIKFLDYTFRRPFFTRFRFLYPASRPASSLAVPYRANRIPDCFSAPTNICTTCSIFHPYFRPHSLYFPFLLRVLCFPPPLPVPSHPRTVFSNLAEVLQRTDAPLQLFRIYRSPRRF